MGCITSIVGSSHSSPPDTALLGPALELGPRPRGRRTSHPVAAHRGYNGNPLILEVIGPEGRNQSFYRGILQPGTLCGPPAEIRQGSASLADGWGICDVASGVRPLWLGFNRRLSKDYERYVQTSETLLDIAAIRLMLNRVAPE